MVKHIVPDGEKGFRYARRCNPAKVLGQWQTLYSGHNTVLGITAACDQRTDFSSGFDTRDAAAESDDIARDFKAGNIGDTLRWRVEATAL